jgi:hypothetical protein
MHRRGRRTTPPGHCGFATLGDVGRDERRITLEADTQVAAQEDESVQPQQPKKRSLTVLTIFDSSASTAHEWERSPISNYKDVSVENAGEESDERVRAEWRRKDRAGCVRGRPDIRGKFGAAAVSREVSLPPQNQPWIEP